MSDLLHKDVPDDYVEQVCRVMGRANWHTYQVLTKRSSLMRNLLQTRLRFAAELPHIWWGVSVEDRAHGLPRVEHLRQAPRRSVSFPLSRSWRISERSSWKASTGLSSAARAALVRDP